MIRVLLAFVALLCAVPAAAQSTFPTPQGGRVAGTVQMSCNAAGTVCATITMQEAFLLVTSNTPSAATAVYGGDYIFAQSCTAYGTLTLQVLGPDGSTYQTILSKTAADTTGGTGLALGSNATVRATVTGTTGCAATLSRVP